MIKMADLKDTQIGKIIIGFIGIILSLEFMKDGFVDNPFSYLINIMGVIGIVSSSAYIVKDIIK